MAPVKGVVETRYTDKEKLLEKLKTIFPYEANASFKIRVSIISSDTLAAERLYAQLEWRLVEIFILSDCVLTIR